MDSEAIPKIVDSCFNSPSGNRIIAVCGVGRVKDLYFSESDGTAPMEFVLVATLEYGTPFVWSHDETKVATIVPVSSGTSMLIIVDITTGQITRHNPPALLFGVDWNENRYMTCLFKPSFLNKLRKTRHGLFDANTGEIIINCDDTLTRKYRFDPDTNPIRWAVSCEEPCFVTLASPNDATYDLIAGRCLGPETSKRDVAASPVFHVSPGRNNILYLSRQSAGQEASTQQRSGKDRLSYFDTNLMKTFVVDEDNPVSYFCWQSDESILYLTGDDVSQRTVRSFNIKSRVDTILFTSTRKISALCSGFEADSVLYIAEGELNLARRGHDGSFDHEVLCLR